eukprot:6202871-Pleurochrysis_carterae.AAC.2
MCVCERERVTGEEAGTESQEKRGGEGEQEREGRRYAGREEENRRGGDWPEENERNGVNGDKCRA